MIKTFTQNDVVRYLYHETSTKENEEIAQALLCDSELEAAYNELKAIKDQIVLDFKNPSEKVINSILEYSRKR